MMLGCGNAIGQTVLYAARNGGRALDRLPAPYALFGAAKLLGPYSGAFARWRRASDNDQQDLWIEGLSVKLAGGEPVTDWLGASDAFGVTWYDQSGNGRHATQTTTAAQARTALAGLVDVGPSGRPAMVFNGTSTFYLVGSSTNFSRVQNALTIAAVASPTNAGTLIGSNNATTIQRASLAAVAGNAQCVARRAAADVSSSVTVAASAGWHRFAARQRYLDGFVDVAVDGVMASAAMNGTPGPSEDVASAAALTIGRPAAFGGSYIAGGLSIAGVWQVAVDIAALDAALVQAAP